MLDERGIEHEDYGCDITIWKDDDGAEWSASNVYRYVDYDDIPEKLIIRRTVTPEEAITTSLGPKITEDTSDGWHTFKELYHHRALLFSVIVSNYRDLCWKSKRHHDGKLLDWNFIVGIDTPWGQASYHYGMEYWDLFDCKVLERAPYYDGYSANESVARIARLSELEPSPLGPRTCRKLPSSGETRCFVSRHGYEMEFGYWKCSNCGTECFEGAKYCMNCGAKVVDE